MGILAPELKEVGEDLNIAGNMNLSERDFPKLSRVGGNLVIYRTGFQGLPKCLNEIGGDVIISDLEPPSLLADLKRAKSNGVINGNIFMIILSY